MIQFLLDYYLGILAILGIIIITVIGFLVDSKQKRKKKEQVSTLNEVKTVEPLPDANSENNINQRNEQIQNVADKVTNDVPITSNVEQANIQTVQQTDSSISNGIYSNKVVNNQNVSLSGQKPHFEAREIITPPPASNNQNINFAVPKPINAVPINQPVQQNYTQMPQQTIQPQPAHIVNNMQQVPVNSVQQNLTSNTMQPSNYPGFQQANYMNASQMQQQPVNVAPNVYSQQTYSSGQNMQQQVTNSNFPNSQGTTAVPNVGISFVTGESNENNVANNNWNL